MKRILVIFTLIMTLFLMAGCNKKKADSIEITNITPGRKDAYVELKINNNNKTIEEETIEGVIYQGSNKMSTFKVTINKDEEDENIKEYIINVAGLAVDENYEIEITALVNKVRKALTKKSFKTTSSGGTKTDPKLIVSIQDFLDMEKDDTAYYRLENDLDFTEVEYKTIFNTASKNFKGELDGNGKTIKNVTLKDRITYSGLIGRNSGTIKNLNVENMKIDYTTKTVYSQYTSLVVGRNIGKIENVKAQGEIFLNFNTPYNTLFEINLGGIAAVMETEGSIKDSEANFTLEVDVTTSTAFNIGGLVGKFREGVVENSKANVTYDIQNSESANIGGAFGFVEYPNRLKAAKIEVESTINLKTKVETVTGSNKIINVNVGGFAGKTNDSKFENVYVKTNIAITEPENTKPKDASASRMFVGGFVGIANNLTLNESAIEGTITLTEDEESTNSSNQFDQVFVGGLVGDSQNGKFGKVLNNGMVISLENISKEAYVNPLIAREINTKIANYAYDDYEVKADNDYSDSEVSYQHDLKHKVTIDYGFENDLVKVFFVDDNKVFARPKTSSRSGYKFVGWYTREGVYNFDNKVTTNLNLVAHWKETAYKYYVGFDLGYDAEDVIEPIQLLDSEVITPTEPTRAGYIFKGWFEKTSSRNPFNFENKIKNDYVFIAKWEVEEGATEQFIVEFELGFASSNQIEPLIIDKDGKATSPSEEPEKTGLVFVGWYLEGMLYDFDSDVTENLVLVARWYKFESNIVETDSVNISTWFTSEWIIDKLN